LKSLDKLVKLHPTATGYDGLTTWFVSLGALFFCLTLSFLLFTTPCPEKTAP